MFTLIFSKDRPAQLDLLLQSMARFVTCGKGVHVVYRATTERYRNGYQQCKRLNPWVEFMDEKSNGSTFRKTITRLTDDLVHALGLSYVWILVDDCVACQKINLYFIHNLLDSRINSDENTVDLFSTRMGSNINYCYAENKTVTPLQHFLGSRGNSDRDFLEWNICNCQGQGDWSYPASLDGTIFPAETLANMIKGATFNNPNTLETMLAERWPKSQGMLAYPDACVIGIPHNKVQDAGYKNRVGTGSAEELNRLFLDGKRIREDLVHDAIIAAKPNACHLELPLERYML